MSYNFGELKTKTKETIDWLSTEFAGVRTGRATTSFLDGIKVSSYGVDTPLTQVASLTLEDVKTIRIAPWDASQIPQIEKAVNDGDIGVSTSSDEKGVRVHFPQLTEETRVKIAKIAKDKYEQARITVRNVRDDAWGEIQVLEKEGEISEDEKFRLKDEMQKIVDATNKDLESLYENKEREILG